jgi:hypothetical protein
MRPSFSITSGVTRSASHSDAVQDEGAGWATEDAAGALEDSLGAVEATPEADHGDHRAVTTSHTSATPTTRPTMSFAWFPLEPRVITIVRRLAQEAPDRQVGWCVHGLQHTVMGVAGVAVPVGSPPPGAQDEVVGVGKTLICR